MNRHNLDIWNIEVPVRKDDFTSLHAEHEECGVTTDLSAIRTFDIAQSKPNPDSIVYADHQTSIMSTNTTRLGSGRSGYYGDWYLKGIGRTTLAANWATPSDWYHGSGHLFPGAAIREYLVSVYMEACGVGHTIVPCVGLLLKPIESRLGSQLQYVAQETDVPMSPLDASLQAISVKPGGFARFSNFLWLVTKLEGTGADFAELAVTMESYCKGRAVDDERVTPMSAIHALKAAIDRTLDSYEAFFSAGVHWGSVYNNSALDGRFLDLELPTITCQPFFGAYSFNHRVDDRSFGDPVPYGTEMIDFALYAQRALTRFTKWLRVAVECCDDRRARAFGAAMVHQLEGQLGREHIVFDRERLSARVTRMLASLPGAPDNVGEIVDDYIRHRFDGARFTMNTPLSEAPIDLAPIEPSTYARIFVSDPGLLRPERWAAAKYLNSHFEAIEAETTVEGAFARVQEAERGIRHAFAPACAV